MTKRILTVVDDTLIDLGYVGDDMCTLVRFPILPIISRYGNGGAFDLLVRSPDSDKSHSVDAVRNGRYVEWAVGIDELKDYGNGEAELVYMDETGKTHRKVWKTVIKRSIIKKSN